MTLLASLFLHVFGPNVELVTFRLLPTLKNHFQVRSFPFRFDFYKPRNPFFT